MPLLKNKVLILMNLYQNKASDISLGFLLDDPLMMEAKDTWTKLTSTYKNIDYVHSWSWWYSITY